MYSLDRALPPPLERPRAVAAFDVDGTLTRRDCVLPFLLRAARWRLPPAFLRRPRATLEAVARRDRDVLKALSCAALRGYEKGVLDRCGTAFAKRVHAGGMRPDTPARLAAHRARGDVVVLVSASLDPYLDPLGVLLGVDAVLCTRLEVGPDGRCTGQLDGPNCRGPEKERRLRAWLGAEGLAEAELWAYGDSSGDDELLAMADHPIRVTRAAIAADPWSGRSII